MANAQAVLATFCQLKSPMRRAAALANVVNSGASGLLAWAKAFAELAMS